MAEFPALPFWTASYMLDCGHLSDAEHGRYLLLLILIWQTPECRVPNEVEWIARKMRRTPGACEAEIMPLVKEFCYRDGNYLYQKRLLKEFLFLQNQSKNQSVRAKSRWNKEKTTYRRDAVPVPEGCRTNALTPTPTPTHIKKEREKVLRKEGKANGKVYVIYGTKAGDAWAAHFKAKGKRAPKDFKGGWFFPTEFPPTEGATQ